jgi:hypothetical protein
MQIREHWINGWTWSFVNTKGISLASRCSDDDREADLAGCRAGWPQEPRIAGGSLPLDLETAILQLAQADFRARGQLFVGIDTASTTGYRLCELKQ